MDFTTVLFGNGLGKAIDSDYFDLSSAISKTWESSSNFMLDEDSKKAILACLPGDPIQINIEEGHLEHLHEVASSCKHICSQVKDPSNILRKAGIKLPKSVDKLICRVGYYFHSFNLGKNDQFDNFVSKLTKFIENYPVHVATLNYDNLVYSRMIDANVLTGFNGHLIDGFTYAGGEELTFSNDNLDRKRDQLGYYLHLHGSPLFISKKKKIVKQKQSGVKYLGYEPHMVLHHVNQKRGVISGSYILNSYWQRFSQSLLQSPNLVLFGYGGFDDHINDLIASRKKDSGSGEFNITIVEWIGTTSKQNRTNFWTKRLKTEEFELVRLPNILEFDFTSLD